MKQKIVIFGITGSVGLQAWELIQQQQQDFELVGFSYHHNHELANQIKQHSNSTFVLCTSDNTISNVENYKELLTKTQPDIVLNSISGFAGLNITQYCLEHGFKLALANKESMVVAGHLIDSHNIIPVDSELSAIYALINKREICLKTIYLTASGGPFYHVDKNLLTNITYKDAIKHPTYQMGAKISIDSATLVNKCFEMIEAFYLFRCNDIRPLYHPTSVVHGLVVDKNNAIYSYMSTPDMKLAINLGLHNFNVANSVIPSLDLSKLTLYFETIDEKEWLPIRWAQELIRDNLPAIGLIITVVDDYLINLFTQSKISFVQITNTIDNYIQKYKNYSVKTWDELYKLKELILLELNSQFS